MLADRGSVYHDRFSLVEWATFQTG
jgi:hypothetical protein